MPAGVHPNSLANLRPLPREQWHKGKKPTLKTKIRRFLNEEVGSYLIDGLPINREDRILLRAIEDAENAAEPIDRHRAIGIVLDRLYGKPVMPIKQSGAVAVNITGIRVSEASAEQRAAIRAKIIAEEGYLLPDGAYKDYEPAEFEEMPNDESGESESEMLSAHRPETP